MRIVLLNSTVSSRKSVTVQWPHHCLGSKATAPNIMKRVEHLEHPLDAGH
jgi:hypothetical protein